MNPVEILSRSAALRAGYPTRVIREQFGRSLIALAEQRDDLVALTADLMYATGMAPFGERFPERLINLGIAEQNMTGVAAGLASVMLTSRLGSTRPSIAVGWELDAVTMAVLGGVSINGGSGNILGVVIAAFVMGLVTFGLGLLNVPGIVMSIFMGLMLILVIALPLVVQRINNRRRAAR